ncbi:pectate lyase family protein [Pseudonocardia nigra]|uniref:pectate lyase family protein n=1 Tax=Pseudonocardia nigra TaxID=1921578 RepID=UPI001C5EF5F0|nr:pectate lyase [Pseudonocardia nigra]
MGVRGWAAAGIGAVALAAGVAPAAVAAPTAEVPLERQVLPPGDGWASVGPGTTGGSGADEAHVFTVRTWEELRAALGGAGARGDTTPRIVRVAGPIDANTGPDGQPLTCEDYADPAYSPEEYLQAYDPATWGDQEPAGPLEDARARSQENQEEQVRQYVGSNVTLVGVGPDARIVGAAMTVRGSTNVIVRNIRFSDAYDCFPAWDPGDSGGTWNSEYDNLWIAESSHVWVDHSTFDDGEHPPSALPEYFGAKYEVHDGLLDITNGADLVTVSWNRFVDHDKVMLIGSSDSRLTDRGKLRVTLHHNLFDRTGQRTPRVRFGQVHVANNHYVRPDAAGYVYSWGVGRESAILAEDNFFDLGPGIAPADIVTVYGGTGLAASGTLVNGRSPESAVDVVAAYNAEHDPDLDPSVTWQPPYDLQLHPTQAVPGVVGAQAGAGRIG